MIFARCGEMLLIIGPIPLVTVTGKMLLIIIVSVVFNLFIGIEASCEILLSPEHGKLQLFGNSQVDSIAVYSCDNGWKLVGASASKCLITGQWTSPPPKCVVEKSSSSFTTATAIVPTSTTVAAALPEPQVIPAENEEDDPQETFQQITYGKNCSCIYNSHDRKLSADVNGLGLWNGDKVGKGDKMTLRCYDQTKNLVLPNATSISGTLEFICNVCRVWEDSDLPSCVDVRSAIPAASVSVGQGVTSTVTSNNSPPKPIASQEISLGEEDDCFCTYNNPDRLLSAKYYNERLSYGDRVKKGTWTRLTCADQVMPLVLPNGTQITGGVLRLTCRVCETWEFDRLPTCEATYHPEPCSIPFVQNGRIGKWVPQSFSSQQKFQKLPVGQRIEDGDKFFLHCDNGYRPLGMTTNWQVMMVCRGGKWPEYPFCELHTCKAEPPAAENGRVEKMDRKHDGTVSYECLPNFSKVKTENVHCNNGEWKGMPPTCKDVRCHAESVRHRTGVDMISKVTQDGDILQVYCKEGYEPRPNLQHCLNGEWRNNQESPCKQKDCTVPWILNGHIEERISEPEKYNWWKMRLERKVSYRRVGVGSVPSRDADLFLVCQERYSIQGTDTRTGGITCSEGRWSPDPVCLRTGTQYSKTTEAPRSVITNRVTEKKLTTIRTTPSTRVTTVSDASRVLSDAVGTKSTTTTGTPVASRAPAEADHGESSGPSENEEFEDECFCEYLPERDGNIVAYADGKEVKMNDKVKNGTVLNLRCEKVGFHKLFGSTEVLCDNCRPWSSSDFPSCVKPQRGETIIVYGMVSVSLDGALEPLKGQPLLLSCAAMETKGYPVWRFPNVTGINVTEERRERTGDILFLSHLYIKNITSKHNGYYSCAFDEEYPTTVELQVVDPEARCRRFLIDDKELHVEYDGADTPVGSRATFSCRRNGQNLNGPSTATCLKNERWSSPPPQCRDIMCRELKESDLMTISYTDHRKIGSFANFHCFAPGIRSGVARTQCLENGEWKDSSPICSTPPCPSASLSQVIPPIVVHDEDDVTDSTMPYNSTVKLMCRGNRNLVGIPFARCGSEGAWEVGNITCITGCPPFVKAAGSRLLIKPEKAAYRIGEIVTFSCVPGYKINIDLEILMCLPSGWSDSALPECIK